jgi:hypothetical protein
MKSYLIPLMRNPLNNKKVTKKLLCILCVLWALFFKEKANKVKELLEGLK